MKSSAAFQDLCARSLVFNRDLNLAVPVRVAREARVSCVQVSNFLNLRE